MPSPVILYPQYQGHRFSHASIEFRFNGLWLLGVKSVNWKASLKAGLVRGTSPKPIGRTAGEAEFTWDCELLRLEWEQLRTTLAGTGIGFGEVSFPITVTLFELGGPTVTDEVRAARIEDVDNSSSTGSDPTMVKLSGTALDVLQNGASITTRRAGAL